MIRKDRAENGPADQIVAAGQRRNVMFGNWRFGCALPAFVCVALGAVPDRASAISLEVARKCDALVAREFPPRIPGNPAAGSGKGSNQDQRAYFNKCVANKGNMDDKPAK
jgi:hypothetical protein